jgi:hypothetical protein
MSSIRSEASLVIMDDFKKLLEDQNMKLKSMQVDVAVATLKLRKMELENKMFLLELDASDLIEKEKKHLANFDQIIQEFDVFIEKMDNILSKQ